MSDITYFLRATFSYIFFCVLSKIIFGNASIISMVIAKTASRNVAFKADMMSKAVLQAQASLVTPEATD